MKIIHGFSLQREQEIGELKTKARIFRHEKTGAELLSLLNDDENKVFGITFRTPPSDSTGVAHILEHSVLCGSRKYPVKEPFVELLKGSLQTFLNAFTYPDKTCYPVASQNIKDFHNLMDVYLDAVFYPRLTPFVFQQEGWHFELESKDKPPVYKGVVFNEMKGAYSSPDSMLSEYSLQSLFPDICYGFDSGGDPKHIPDLGFEQFKAFHRSYYHPSNARIFLYGDSNPEQSLRLIDDYLKDFSEITIDSTISPQPSFDSPKRIIRSFITGEEESARTKGMITLNWLFAESVDVQRKFAFIMLEYILLGMPGSPLRKALIDSGLGDDIAGEGLGNELRQAYFSTGLKGIKMENVDRIEALILETLTGLVREGIDPNTIEAALNTIEFGLRENNTGSFPRGLSLMLRSLTTWLYNGDPLTLLAFERPLKEIKKQLKSNGPFFEEMINRYLLKNPHRTTVILKPDPDMREREEAQERNRLTKAHLAMSQSQAREVIENTRKLKRLQGEANSPEALETIPALKITDIDKRNKIIPIASFSRHGATVLFHDLFTNGVAYLDVGLNLHGLPEQYIPYVPLFGRSLVEMGTDKEDFVTLTQRISRKTGGIGPQIFTSGIKDAKQSAAWLFLRGKAMMSQTEELTGILSEMLLDLRLDNQERFRQMMLEEKARTEQKLIPAGHLVVDLRLRSHFGEAQWASEQISGISYLFFLRELALAVDENWPAVLSVLEEMRSILVNRNTMITNVTLDEENWHGFEPHINDLLDALPEGVVAQTDWLCKSPALFEGMIVPSQVSYVGKGADLYELGYRFHGSALVITRYLRNSWLWDRIRVQGGAYGAFCSFDRLSGVLTFVSYRDPNPVKTLEAFDLTGHFLNETKFSNEELTKSIIGTIGDIDAYLLPDAKGYISMLRYLISDTEEDRQQVRDEVLGTRISDFKAFANDIEQVKEKGLVKVLGSSSAIDAVSNEWPGWLDIVKVL